ncbi:MAG: hypothetical protein HKO94_09155 [Flavobacteriaceae bacterium]|nr:hypothetical protein [Flavobacteriaceae bacterium]
MKRKWLILLGLGLLITFLIYNYIYKEHRDISSEQAEFMVTADLLLGEFEADDQKATAKYLNKTIQVEGLISDLENQTIIIDQSVFCLLEQASKSVLKVKSHVKIKGRLIGYDDLLNEIKFDQCIIIN